MTEDEAFIRAIVDNRGDDISRLVYADWLDDRDDPRGAYLRAEHGAAGSVQLRELAMSRDPVWVARVSRPPLGVCCDELTWSERGAIVDGADLNRFETRFGITLPPQYRAFLLNYNGGLIGRGQRDHSCRFYSIAGTSSDDPPLSVEYEYAYRRDSVFRGTRRENDSLRVSLHNSMFIGTVYSGTAWVLLGIGPRNGGIRSLANGFPAEDSASPHTESLRFSSLAEYLLSLCEHGAAT